MKKKIIFNKIKIFIIILMISVIIIVFYIIEYCKNKKLPVQIKSLVNYKVQPKYNNEVRHINKQIYNLIHRKN